MALTRQRLQAALTSPFVDRREAAGREDTHTTSSCWASSLPPGLDHPTPEASDGRPFSVTAPRPRPPSLQFYFV